MPYVDLDGVSTYYEHAGGDLVGGGRPLVLLHGAFSGADAFAAQLPAMVGAGFEVWVPERRGHARTADTDAPFTYAAMAEETVAFLDTVLGRPAAVVGWSDGAVVGALVAMDRPDLVDRLVLIGQYYDLSGQANPGLGAALASIRDDPPTALRGNYDNLSPDGPEHFPVVFAKTVDMLVTEPTIPMAELARITAPTLVLQGDRDEVRLSHSVEVVATLPDARLAVLPGTHALPVESPRLVNAVLLDFLAHGVNELHWADALGP
jgi:pimeloyl-ACP methyl ester carboxylesterase